MAKKIIVTGKPARRIEVTGKRQRRIEPEKLAAALGAEPLGEAHAPALDPISLAALGSELIKRLRSSGGRPALTDATEVCRVPLSAEDLKALEGITVEIEQSTGMKPSVGQVVGVIVRDYLTRRPAKTAARATEEPKEASNSVASWLPHLAEIASKASIVQQAAGAIEAAMEQIKKDIKAVDSPSPRK
jgi:hypothetical protein